jgi:hypothetical protein
MSRRSRLWLYINEQRTAKERKQIVRQLPKVSPAKKNRLAQHYFGESDVASPSDTKTEGRN